MAHRTRRPDKRLKHMSFNAAGAIEMTSPLQIALRNATLLQPRERDALLSPTQAAFTAFRAGQGNVDHWAQLVDAINIALVLAHRQIASDHIATFNAAVSALRAVHDRHALAGSWTLRGTEIAALDMAVTVHKIQLDYCSAGELSAAIQTVINRVRAALAGNASPGAHICMPGQISREVAANPSTF